LLGDPLGEDALVDQAARDENLAEAPARQADLLERVLELQHAEVALLDQHAAEGQVARRSCFGRR
jgi:hypothetical protein